jgi:galactonate dehydratase
VKTVAGMADAHYGVVAPHNAQGPVCSIISMHLGASTPNFYYQESFDVFNEPWTREIATGEPVTIEEGHVVVSSAPGLGIDLDWDRLSEHPYRRRNALKLFEPGWERRSPDLEE